MCVCVLHCCMYYLRHGNTIANDDPSIDDKIYLLLDGIYPCFRLTNATHQIGCSGDTNVVTVKVPNSMDHVV